MRLQIPASAEYAVFSASLCVVNRRKCLLLSMIDSSIDIPHLSSASSLRFGKYIHSRPMKFPLASECVQRLAGRKKALFEEIKAKYYTWYYRLDLSVRTEQLSSKRLFCGIGSYILTGWITDCLAFCAQEKKEKGRRRQLPHWRDLQR